MAVKHWSALSNAITIPGTSDEVLAPDELAADIHNFELVEEGYLRAVKGPVPFMPLAYSGGSSYTYGTPFNGIFHGKLGPREMLFAHFQEGGYSRIAYFEGSNQTWQTLISDNVAGIIGDRESRSAGNRLEESDGRVSYLTQFVQLPNSILIIPQGERAYQFDGEVILPLGYAERPSAPTPMGPRSATVNEIQVEAKRSGDYSTTDGSLTNYYTNASDLPNMGGYAHDTVNELSALGTFRLGTVEPNYFDTSFDNDKERRRSNPLGGTLLEGEWRAQTQFINHFGDLSPLSELSDPIRLAKRTNATKERKKDAPQMVERLKMQGAWKNIDRGPVGTIGRLLGRTQDIKLRGSTQTYEVPSYVGAGEFRFTSLPDNITTVFPDNVPDSWLVSEMTDYAPVPEFRLACMWNGRLWIANIKDSPNLLRPSLPGRFGTFPLNQEIYPDVTADGITGLHATSQALLVFTRTSTFAVYVNDRGDGFRLTTLSTTQGCIAPDSIKTLPTGETIWLGVEGMYRMSPGTPIELMGLERKQTIFKRMNKAWAVRACAAVDAKMGEYRCWLPLDGSTENNICVVYSGGVLRTRDDVYAAAVCTKQDHTGQMLALGKALVGGVRTGGVWVLDHDAPNSGVDQSEARIETTWLRATRSHRAGRPEHLYAMFRETSSGQVSVEVMRDWREHPVMHTSSAKLSCENNRTCSFYWDTLALDGTHEEGEDTKGRGISYANYFSRGRPFWQKVAVHAPSAASFKVRLTGTGDWGFIQFQYDETDAFKGSTALLDGDQ